MKFLTSLLMILSACTIITSKSFAQQWEVERNTDPITDSQNVIARLGASNDRNGFIVVQCVEQRKRCGYQLEFAVKAQGSS